MNMSDTVKIEQRLLKVDELFVYKIPPMKTASGHQAELWDLSKPLATCTLLVVRRDDVLCIDIMAKRPKPNGPAGAQESYLFAQSYVDVNFSKPGNQIEHWVLPAIDSSRYFALRIRDSNTEREAFIGIGFRERLDATNFRMSLDDYLKSLHRESKAAELRKNYEQSEERHQMTESEGSSDQIPSLAKSDFRLKEGEKIHMNIIGKPRSKVGSGSNVLKPPPPPAQLSVSTIDSQADFVEWSEFEG